MRMSSIVMILMEVTIHNADIGTQVSQINTLINHIHVNTDNHKASQSLSHTHIHNSTTQIHMYQFIYCNHTNHIHISYTDVCMQETTIYSPS